jgi:ketosteroid isomerase-like protein
VWRVAGANAMSGEYRGRDAILRFLRETLLLTGGTYRTELRYVVADDERAVAVYRARGERDARSIDIDQALFCVVRDGRLAEITAVPFDAAAFDAFWA